MASPAGDVLLVRVRPGEVRLARVTAKGKLADFVVHRRVGADQRAPQAGDVVLGRVKAVAPQLEAAFVDIGADRDGFLGLADARPHHHHSGGGDRITDHVHEGEAVLVHVTAEPRDDKGAKLSRRISIAGALAVLTPGDGGVRVSKRVDDGAVRAHLRAVIADVLPKDTGCVIRSAAEDAGDKELKADIQLLSARWNDIRTRAESARAPMCLTAQEVPPVQYVLETGVLGLDRIVVDDGAMAQATEAELRRLNIDLPGGVVRHGAGRDVFEDFAVAEAIQALTDSHVALPSGGSLIIEETAALTAIDVNAGRARGGDVALTVSIEAVREAARQMRLRNLTGLIVLDMLSLKGEGAQKRVLGALRDALVLDPAGPYILGFTRAGLLELTRPRRRPPLSHILLGPCPTCGGARAETPLTTGLGALDRVLAEVWASPALVPVLRAPPDVVRALERDAPDALAEMEARLGQPLDLLADLTLAPGTTRIEPLHD